MSDFKNGYLIVYVMVLTFITMSIGLSVLSVAGTQYTHVTDDIYRQDVVYGAKACATIVAEKLTDDASFSGFSNQVIFDDLNSSQGQVACSATVANGSGGAKNVDITSTMQRFASDPNPISYQVRAVLQPEGGSASGSADYLNGGIFVGSGGFYAPLWGNIITSQLHVVGKIYGSNISTSKIGTSSSPIPKITVANIACGDSSNWPQPCTTDPVMSFTGGIFNDIYGDTCAPGQTANLYYIYA